MPDANNKSPAESARERIMTANQVLEREKPKGRTNQGILLDLILVAVLASLSDLPEFC
jgi:hypothetical protein